MVLDVKAVVATFNNQEKALVGAFSVITNLRMDLFEALVARLLRCRQGRDAGRRTRGQNFANIGYNERLHSQLSPPVEAAEATT